MEGAGEVTVRALVRNALRMRPDRIIVGEVRGGEALDMLQAMNTGHEGSLSTAHANSPRDLLSRLETMALMADVDLPLAHVRDQIASAIHLVVHMSRRSDGLRVIAHVSAVEGLRAGTILTQDIFKWGSSGEFAVPGRSTRIADLLRDRDEDIAQVPPAFRVPEKRPVTPSLEPVPVPEQPPPLPASLARVARLLRWPGHPRRLGTILE
jgi:pilus assembly protein CpaF